MAWAVGVVKPKEGDKDGGASDPLARLKVGLPRDAAIRSEMKVSKL